MLLVEGFVKGEGVKTEVSELILTRFCGSLNYQFIIYRCYYCLIFHYSKNREIKLDKLGVGVPNRINRIYRGTEGNHYGNRFRTR